MDQLSFFTSSTALIRMNNRKAVAVYKYAGSPPPPPPPPPHIERGIALALHHSYIKLEYKFLTCLFHLFQSEEPNATPFEVTLFHYLAWPDHGVPNNAISMVNFIKRVRKAHPYSRQDLLLVHCSAGVGRTGTFITLDSMMERIKTEDSINIFEFVSNLRKQRVLMVQTSVKAITYALCGNEIGSTSHCPVAKVS